MEKIIRVGRGDHGNIFCKISFVDGKLSISGVEGPNGNGDAIGACGQIVMHKWNIKEYAPGFNKETVEKFRQYWDKWHLNDMRPNCQHQTGEAWTSKEVKIYCYQLTAHARKAQKDAEKEAMTALKEGKTFTPTIEQSEMANLFFSFKSHESTPPKHYELSTSKTGYFSAVEKKSTGWLTEKDHPDGFLSKACQVCGYKYGSKWINEEVPQNVIDFLFSLPDTDIKPAWV